MATVSRLFVFGDSFSDIGAYAAVSKAAGVEEGGRFTTNPDPMWIEYVAHGLGLTLTSRALGGTNYAEGFARVALPSPPIEGLGQRCARDQVEAMLGEYGQPKPDDVVVINAGGNDVLLAALAGGAVEPLVEAAAAFAAILKRLSGAGARNIFVVATPNLGSAPVGGSGRDGEANPLTLLVRRYNDEVRRQVDAAGLRVHTYDAFAFIDQMFYQPGDFGLTNVIDQACPGAEFAAFLCPRAQQDPRHATMLMADRIHLAGTPQRHLGKDFARFLVARLG
jgi:outer membrane lipase/esterase